MKAKRALEKAEVEYNTLTVVDNSVARNVKEIYDFFKKEKLKCTQYIPCLDSLMTDKKRNTTYLSTKAYSTFLKKLFDLWYKDLMKGKYVSIRYFDNLINIILGRGGEACDMRGHCSIQNVIEADGSVYTCDFYVYENWKLGNIQDDSFEDIIMSSKSREFFDTSLEKSSKCGVGKWANICRGDIEEKKKIPRN